MNNLPSINYIDELCNKLRYVRDHKASGADIHEIGLILSIIINAKGWTSNDVELEFKRISALKSGINRAEKFLEEVVK